MKTAAIVIIGNEILSGKVQDTNSNYLARELRELGVDVRRVITIPDEVDTIAREVAGASAAHDFVFTSGGIGPTHDDVTISGVASAFGLRKVVNEGILEFVKARCGDRLSDVAARIAEVPEGAEVIQVEGMNFPPLAVRNVYVFPGIPELLRKKFAAIRDRFRSAPFYVKKVFINTEECFIADILNRVDGEFAEVMVGSYPKVSEPDYKVMVVLESRDKPGLGKAYGCLMDLLPPEVVVREE